MAELLTAAEAAELLGITVTQLHARGLGGGLAPTRGDGGLPMWEREAVECVVEHERRSARPQPSPEEAPATPQENSPLAAPVAPQVARTVGCSGIRVDTFNHLDGPPPVLRGASPEGPRLFGRSRRAVGRPL